MARKVLIPVFPSERFYDAVVAAGDLASQEGGTVTFLFTEVRPPPEVMDDDNDGQPSNIEVETSGDGDPRDFELWQQKQIAGLEDARQLLYERGIRDDRISYLFADEADMESAAQAIADEAAAGSYDLVVLSRGYFAEEVRDMDSTAGEVTEAIRDLNENIKVMVT